MKNAQFKFYSSNISFNNISVAVYENKKGNYLLQVEKDGRKVRGTNAVEMTKEQYEDLPFDDYNSLVRFQAAAKVCGYTI
ncbi:TPA: hypothetical protein RVS92_000442 [Pasteurella multocida]|uniref:hypothetical protein n=1 Tax=Pasteurella multocida TaxID=747 RepID=UPI0028DEDE19|nr:hypothetical protein [Pasteurella multocida]HEH9653076.1 hypothetical protein [Pasteurella multocida]HEH9693851.1 hypothetical protein [Pasteurella multocida]HEH9773058.1 hypothetical protein [Pasteurella multocida]HEH9835089.1 hypothetical protein [Pasteurella multocida]